MLRSWCALATTGVVTSSAMAKIILRIKTYLSLDYESNLGEPTPQVPSRYLGFATPCG